MSPLNKSFNLFIILALLCFIPRLFCFNAFLISIGHAGHVTPLFELAKALRNHNITFLTQPLAQGYINVAAYSNSSSLRVIYTNDSSDAFIAEKQQERELIAYSANHSFFDSMGQTTRSASVESGSLLNKTIHILMANQFDVIIANSLVPGIHILCKQTNTPCVIQSTESLPNMLDLNIPNMFSLLSREQMTQLKYRIYNVVFSLRLVVIFVTKLLPTFGAIAKSLPKVPGPFYDSFSMSSLLSSKSHCLDLVSMPPTFYTPSYRNHHTKYLGAFIDETSIKSDDNELTQWIKSKPESSIIYGAFGTSSLVQYDRMKNLLSGVAKFLLRTPGSFLLLIFRESNYETYRAVLNDMKNDEYLRIFMDKERVKIENQFVQQKWILQQNSIKIFLSHCGMGSCSEGMYFHKPILCMPFNMDQFVNAAAIEHATIGLSLFVPPSLYQSLLKPYHFYDYTFSSESVTMKLTKIWENEIYQKMMNIMSLEMKHAGGLEQAVKEIEFFIHLNGNLDRYAPFQSTLPFYQRYMLDLLVVFVILPLMILVYGIRRCCKRPRKVKND